MAYPREDIDRVRDRTDLVELVAEVTKVKRSGRSAMAICPFHQEKTPSLSIDPGRGLYHCFGCGKSGDVFRFVQETQSVDFAGAVELLARRAGLTLTPVPGSDKARGQREALVQAVDAAVVFYHERLRHGDDAGAARAYLRGRGYDAEVVERFRIGFAPGTWDSLVKHLREKGLADGSLVKAGLASRGGRGGLIDRFRGRLMFPIYDLRGDAVGFGARLLEGEGPKYLNSPETPIYHKSRLLYGLNLSKSEIVRRHEAVVVEGYTDVIGFDMANLPIAVATCGTALGEGHLDLLRRFTDRVVLAFDADEAGASAALRGFERAVPGDLDLRLALLPAGRDPADLVLNGDVELLRKSVAESLPLLQFRIEDELAHFDLNEPEGRGRAVRAAAAIVARHPDSVVQHEYAVLIARRTGVALEVVADAVAKAARRGREGAVAVGSTEERLSGEEKAERELLRLILANDPGIHNPELGADLFADDLHRRAYERISPTILALEPGDPPDLAGALGGDESPPAELLRSLAIADHPLPDAGELIIRLKVGVVERRIEKVRAELEDLDPQDQSEKYSAMFGELIALERQRRDLRSRE